MYDCNWISSNDGAICDELIDEQISEIVGGLRLISMYKIKGFGNKTKAIKGKLAKIGCKNKYRVYANKLSERLQRMLKLSQGRKKYEPNKEWLLDIIWTIENDAKEHEYETKKVVLGVECEWGCKRRNDVDEYGHVKYDFQKLLVTESDLCVMIFKWRKKDEKLIAAGKENALSEYFQNAVNGYEGYLKNRILCIGYCNKFESFYFRIFENKKCNE